MNINNFDVLEKCCRMSHMKKNITNSKMGTYELKILNIHMKFFRLISTIIVILL